MELIIFGFQILGFITRGYGLIVPVGTESPRVIYGADYFWFPNPRVYHPGLRFNRPWRDWIPPGYYPG